MARLCCTLHVRSYVGCARDSDEASSTRITCDTRVNHGFQVAPLAHPDAAGFLCLRCYLHDSESEPDAAWLESLGSVLKQSRAHVSTAAELIVSGIQKRPHGKRISNMA